MQTPPTWSGLEVVKLLVSALTPIMVLVVGWWISRRQKRLDSLQEKQNLLQQKQLDFLQWTNQKVTEKRLAIFDKLAPEFNALFCYFTFVGSWREVRPPDVVSRKREMDSIVHINAPLFSREFVNRYYEFINACYETYTGWGRDAKLRTLFENRKLALGTAWQPEWEECFVNPSSAVDPNLIKKQYELLMKQFSTELGIGLDADLVSSGPIPANIR
jgi:hypothetical protein